MHKYKKYNPKSSSKANSEYQKQDSASSAKVFYDPEKMSKISEELKNSKFKSNSKNKNLKGRKVKRNKIFNFAKIFEEIGFRNLINFNSLKKSNSKEKKLSNNPEAKIQELLEKSNQNNSKKPNLDKEESQNLNSNSNLNLNLNLKEDEAVKNDWQKVVTANTSTRIKNSKSNSIPVITPVVDKIKILFFKWRVLERINLFTAGILSLSMLSLILYLALFDRYFLIKNYIIKYDDSCFEGLKTGDKLENCSYLSKQETENLIKEIHNNNFLGVAPNNQFWFASSRSLTESARNVSNFVTSVELEERIWPDTAVLKIKTEPILLTLQINQDQYWRISQSGDVISQDNAGLKERLVTVNRQVRLKGKAGATFKDYSFEVNNDQRNRFWFVIWLWNEMEKRGVEINDTSFPSLFDSDVILKTKSGTNLIFDYTAVSRSNQEKRIDIIFSDLSRIKEGEQSGKYAYIDFRTSSSKKIFLCEKGRACDN